MAVDRSHAGTSAALKLACALEQLVIRQSELLAHCQADDLPLHRRVREGLARHTLVPVGMVITLGVQQRTLLGGEQARRLVRVTLRLALRYLAFRRVAFSDPNRGQLTAFEGLELLECVRWLLRRMLIVDIDLRAGETGITNSRRDEEVGEEGNGNKWVRRIDLSIDGRFAGRAGVGKGAGSGGWGAGCGNLRAASSRPSP